MLNKSILEFVCRTLKFVTAHDYKKFPMPRETLMFLAGRSAPPWSAVVQVARGEGCHGVEPAEGRESTGFSAVVR